tara:strand:+ start:163 stop:753 length:591 start_codon:yes stop_codon:yes gene_type:complete
VAEDLLEEIDENGALTGGGEEIDAPAKKKSFLSKLPKPSKKWMIIGAIVLIVLGGGAGALFFFFSGDDEAEMALVPETVQEISIQEALDKKDEMIFEDVVVLAPFVRIPLRGSSAMGMISLNISLELTDHRYRKSVVTMEDRIRKIVTQQVREMTWLELRHPQGKIELKYALLKRMNGIFPKVMIRNVYFTNFLMQ